MCSITFDLFKVTKTSEYNYLQILYTEIWALCYSLTITFNGFKKVKD